MVISCVAEPNATINAYMAMIANCVCGSLPAIPSNPPAITICANNIHERRLPSLAVSHGIGTRSTTGAQNTLIE